MGTTDHHQADDGAWASLRALLVGGDPGEFDDQALARAAVVGDVAPLAAALCPGIRELLSSRVEHQIFAALLLDRAMAEAARATANAHTGPIVLLKGTAAAHQVYENPSHRVGVDIDVLVEEDAFDRILEVLRGAGFRDATSPELLRRHGPRPWEHELAWVTDGGSVSLDVHRKLAASERFRVDHGGLLARAVPVEGLPWGISHPEDTLLHTVLHLATNRYAVPLKSWIDLVRLLDHEAVDLARVVERAVQWRMATALWAALTVCERWFETETPPGLMGRIAPAPGLRHAVAAGLSADGRWPIRGNPYGTVSRFCWGPLLADDLASAWAWARESARQVKRVASASEPG